MKTFRFPFLAGALLAALPLAALLPGCGGGGGGSNSPDATATPVANPTSTAAATSTPGATVTATPAATATATPSATATPVATAMPVQGTLASINLTTAPSDNYIAVMFYKQGIQGTQTVTKTSTAFTFSSRRAERSGSRYFKFSLNSSTPLQTGQSFTVGGTAATASVSAGKEASSGAGGIGTLPFASVGTSGTLTITALSATSITVRFDQVALNGPLTLNGTVESKLP